MVRLGGHGEGPHDEDGISKVARVAKGENRNLGLNLLPVMPHILLVEDEPSIADTLVYALETEGFTCTWVTTGRQALEAFDASIDGVILDVGLPDANGFDLCRTLRAKRDLPILFLTARSGEIDRIVGLEIGADDYVTKPFSPREVTARLRAVMRRYRPHDPEKKAAEASTLQGANHGLVDYPEQCRMIYRGQGLDLSPNEYRLLAVLLAHPGRVYSRQQLMQAAWDSVGSALERTVDAHIKSIRAKLRAAHPSQGSEDELLITHRGFGYSFKD
jgi:two-component system, OmpR family, catabolic regulation response regulator CreB